MQKLTWRSASALFREPNSTSATVGLLVGSSAGCQKPQAESSALTSAPAWNRHDALVKKN